MKLSKVTLAVFCFSSTLAFAQSNGVNLNTESINEIGVTISAYDYKEPSLNVSMKATNWGVDYTGTYSFGNNWFVLGNANYNNGSVDYSGTGTQNGIPQYYYNFKGAVGYDFAFDGFVISPYVGYGYRFLSQQWGGTATSTGARGYDRQSTYNYLPIGLIHRFAVSDTAKLETTLEYDYLLSGNQYSGTSSLNGTYSGVTVAGAPNSNNTQNSGYGINLTVMYKEANWGVGPYYKYWNIQQSNTNYANVQVGGSTVRYSLYEPANNTNEYGIKAIYRF